jgi:vitamin B12 transporter
MRLRGEGGSVMRKKSYYLALGLAGLAYGQDKVIDTVVVGEKAWQKAYALGAGKAYAAEDLQKNSANFSDFLRFQSNIYSKEQSRGGISSPGFRGTTAQQTSVLWNGLNINSGFLGQTDLNTVSGLSYEQVLIKPGENAIGGSIALNNQFSFGKGWGQQLFVNYGDFASLDAFGKLSFSTKNYSIVAKYGQNQSQNNYPYQLGHYRGTAMNGGYQRQTVDLGAAYRLGNHQLEMLTQHYWSDQGFPIFFENQTKTKYQNQNLRSLLQWRYQGQSYQQQLKLAYVEEQFAYFGNADAPKTSGGKLGQYVVQQHGQWQFLPQWDFGYQAQYQQVQAQGYASGIGDVGQQTLVLSGRIKQNIGDWFQHEAGVKQHFLVIDQAPWLYHYHSKIKLFSFWQSHQKFTKNFRIPTFNDRYWKDAGNPNLKPETAYLFETNQILNFRNVQFKLNAYLNNVTDLIRWVPMPSGLWQPTNTNKVLIKGLEANADVQYQWQGLQAKFNAGYSYTLSTDQATGKQLMYVPFHKVHFNTDWRYHQLSAFSQWLYQGLTYSSSDEEMSSALKSYFLCNLGLAWQVSPKLKLGAQVHNVGAQIYQTVVQMPQPLRYYSFNLNLNL